MRIWLVVVCLLGWLLHPPVAGAAGEVGASLEELLVYAEEHNPGFAASRARLSMAEAAARQAGVLPDPVFSYGYYLREVETRVGPQEHRLGVRQAFPWPGTLADRREVAGQTIRVEKNRHESARLALHVRIARAWYELALIHRILSIEEENRALLVYLEEVITTRYRSGGVRHAALIRAQVERERREDVIAGLREQLLPVQAGLNAALGRSAGAEVPLPGDTVYRPVTEDVRRLRPLLPVHNPELAALSAEEERAAAGVALSARRQYPGFTLGLDYIVTDDAENPGVRDSGKDPVIASLSLSVPLWRGAYAAVRREAAQQLHGVQNRHEESRHRLLAEWEQIWFKLRDARRRILLYRETLVPRAEQLVEVTRQSFSAGGADVLDLIDAQQTLLDLQLAEQRALFTHAVARAELSALLGGQVLR